MEGTKIELLHNILIVVKETFEQVQEAIFLAEQQNKKFICLTTKMNKKSPVMININHIIYF